MSRPLLIGLALVVALSGGVALYLTHVGQPVKALPAPITNPALMSQYTEQGASYRISAAYPTTTPAGEAAAEEMQGWVIGEITRFKDHVASGTPSSLTITYDASSTTGTASYLFTENVGGTLSTKAFTFTRTVPSTP